MRGLVGLQNAGEKRPGSHTVGRGCVAEIEKWPNISHFETETQNFLIWIVRGTEKTGITTKQLLLNMEQCLIQNHMAR